MKTGSQKYFQLDFCFWELDRTFLQNAGQPKILCGLLLWQDTVCNTLLYNMLLMIEQRLVWDRHNDNVEAVVAAAMAVVLKKCSGAVTFRGGVV